MAIKVTVNGSSTSLPSALTIAELLAHLELPDRGVAVAVNREVIARSSWQTSKVGPNDAIEIVSAAAGG